MVVPTEHALNEAIQVSPLVLSDDVRQQKVSEATSPTYLIDFGPPSAVNFQPFDAQNRGKPEPDRGHARA